PAGSGPIAVGLFAGGEESMRTWVGPFVGMFLVCSSSLHAQAAATPDEVQRLREEVEQLRQSLAALEARLDSLQAPPAPPAAEAAPPAAPPAAAPQATAAPPGTAEVPAGASGAGGPSGPLAVSGGATGSKVFNPDIAVIGNFQAAIGSPGNDGQPSLEMREAEASFQAVVDPYARADFFLTFGPEGAGIEEGYLTFPTLPAKLLMKVGKMRTAFGKVDSMHAHTLPWTDRPLVTQNLLGGEDGLADSGVSLSRLIPIPGLFLEATGQV